MNLNLNILTGKVATTPTTARAANTDVVRFSIYSSTKKGESIPFDISYFGDDAKDVAMALDQGDEVIVIGRTHTYKPQRDGLARAWSMTIYASHIGIRPTCVNAKIAAITMPAHTTPKDDTK